LPNFQALPAGLGAFPHHLENTFGEINILDIEMEHFRETNAGVEQQQEEGIVSHPLSSVMGEGDKDAEELLLSQQLMIFLGTLGGLSSSKIFVSV
jgi:hypothetical protein